mmetsp:Transcript_34473/g.67449  ORF Transcript_34473/g.67449 Transcript_34473/m.67449 type:complete len:208 (-) Transcript_34473:608-1231(-)
MLSQPLTLRYRSVTRPLKLFCTSRPIILRMSSTMGRHLMPVAHTTTDEGMASMTLLPFFWIMTWSALTDLTNVLLSTSIFSVLKCSTVYSEIFLSNIDSTVSIASTRRIVTRPLSWGNEFLRSSCTRSASSAANSTPVGPPPTTTKLRRRLRSSSDCPGLAALSKASVMAERMRRASEISLRKWACCCTPGVLKVLFSAPTATTSLS